MHCDRAQIWFAVRNVAAKPTKRALLGGTEDRGRTINLTYIMNDITNNANDGVEAETYSASDVMTQLLGDMHAKLRSDVIRGLRNKANHGWYPYRAPEGCLNARNITTGESEIVADPERFPIIRKAWDIVLGGGSVSEAMAFLNSAGYRTRPSRRQTDHGMLRGALNRLFANRFYTGRFIFDGQWRAGNHPAMVSDAEFDEAQKRMAGGRDTK